MRQDTRAGSAPRPLRLGPAVGPIDLAPAPGEEEKIGGCDFSVLDALSYTRRGSAGRFTRD